MVALIAAIVIGFFLYAVFKQANNPNQSVAALDRVASRGLPARGLILLSNQLGSGVTLNGRRFDRRQMTIDVEIPGRPPYVQSGLFLIPRGVVEPVPGASLDLAVDPRNPSQVVVLGPGGFSGPWIRVGPPQPY